MVTYCFHELFSITCIHPLQTKAIIIRTSHDCCHSPVISKYLHDSLARMENIETSTSLGRFPQLEFPPTSSCTGMECCKLNDADNERDTFRFITETSNNLFFFLLKKRNTTLRRSFTINLLEV